MSVGDDPGPVPGRDEIARDLIKWFVGKYGVAAWDAFWATPQPIQDLLDKMREQQAQKQLPSGPSSGGGTALALVALAAFAGSRKGKRRSKRRR